MKVKATTMGSSKCEQKEENYRGIKMIEKLLVNLRMNVLYQTQGCWYRTDF